MHTGKPLFWTASFIWTVASFWTSRATLCGYWERIAQWGVQHAWKRREQRQSRVESYWKHRQTTMIQVCHQQRLIATITIGLVVWFGCSAEIDNPRTNFLLVVVVVVGRFIDILNQNDWRNLNSRQAYNSIRSIPLCIQCHNTRKRQMSREVS
jgi:hypothetical protein